MNDIIQSALQKLEISSLTPMQEATIQAISEQKDVILLSPTGSGKTLAFLLPLLQTLLPNHDGVQALVLAPSRELALQTETVFKRMTNEWKVCCCYGGHSVGEEKKNIESNHPTLLIGTPGRILDHLQRGNINGNTIRILMIDEFDKSLELGFQEEMESIIEQLGHLSQRILLSATDMEELPSFIGLQNPVRLDFLQKEGEARLELRKVLSPEKDKIDTLFRLLCTLGNRSSIVFCNHREAAERVGRLLSERKMPNVVYHGGMEQPDRERALYKFRNGSCYVLVSTDLAARGLDIPEVEHIIHYHLPLTEDAFIHRNGRTARWQAKGISFLILSEAEKLPDYINIGVEEYELPDVIAKPAKLLWTTIYIGKGKKDKVNKIDIVGFLCKKGRLSREDMGAIDVKERYSFVAVRTEKVNEMLKLVVGEKIKGVKAVCEIAD
jgi:superfamily II DNA/RNA helicase